MGLRELPLVCICIPTYNAAATIRETLESILGQTYRRLVVHVSDNASTDGTLSIAKSLQDLRIHVHANDQNVGAEGNFNRCIDLVEGKYAAIFHADDIYEPDMVAKQVAFLEGNPNVGAVFTAATTVDANGRALGVIGRNGRNKKDASVYDFPRLLKTVLHNGNFIVCPSAMARTHIYKNEIQRWRGDLFRSSADLDVWLRIASAHSVAVLTTPLMRYRLDGNQFSSGVRMRTDRADFFLVTDYYLAKSDVQLLLGNDDKRHFRQLVINDRVWRAINQFARGNLSDAKQLIRGSVNFDALRGAITSRRGLFTLLASLALNFMIVLNLVKSGKTVINTLRGRLNK